MICLGQHSRCADTAALAPWEPKRAYVWVVGTSVLLGTVLNEGDSQWQPGLHDPSERQCDDELWTVMCHCTEDSGILRPMSEATRGWKPPACSLKES